jgi:Uma2 family endonuclease
VTLAEKHFRELPQRRRWSREMYYRAVDAGVFGEDEHIELIGGEIVEQMAPQKSTHSWTISAAEKQLSRVIGDGYWVRVQMPLSLGQDSDPEPDVSVVAGHMDEFKAQHPTSAVLVVEVSDASLSYDRRFKASLYAASKVPEYWIINLIENCVEVFQIPEAAVDEPFGYRYSQVVRHAAGDSILPLVTPESTIPVSRLLP